MPTNRPKTENRADLLMRQVTQGKLTPQQQLEALRKTQAQAEQRVRLGVKLFEAAEGRLKSQHQALTELRENQQALREQMLAEIRQAATGYDERLTRLETRVSDAVAQADARITALQQSWQAWEARLNRLVSQAQSLLERPDHATSTPPSSSTATGHRPTQRADQAAAAHDIAKDSPDTNPPAAATEEEAWNTVYHRALMWLGESATEKREAADESNR